LSRQQLNNHAIPLIQHKIRQHGKNTKNNEGEKYFPYRQFYPKDATILQVGIEPGHLGRRTDIIYRLCGDVKATIEGLLPYLTEPHDGGHLKRLTDHYCKVRDDLDELAIGKPGHKPIHPHYLTKAVSDLASENAVFTCDVGTPTL